MAEEKKTKEPTKEERIEAMLGKINAKYGGVMTYGKEVIQTCRRIPTGSVMLDYACIGEGAVFTDPITGEVNTIENIVDNEIHMNLVALKNKQDGTNTVIDKISEFHDNGRKKVFEVVFRHGDSRLMTEDHIVTTDAGEITIREAFTYNRKVLSLRKISVGSVFDGKMISAHLRFLGMYLGDGWLNDRGLFISERKTEDTNLLIKDVCKELDLILEYKKYEGDSVGSFKIEDQIGGFRNWNGRISSTNPMIHMLTEFGLANKTAGEKFIPSIIFSLRDNCIAEFLSHLFVTDGNISKTRYHFSYSTKSKIMAYQIQMLLLRIGVPSKVKFSSTDNATIYFYGKSKFDLLVDKFEWLGRLGDRVKELNEKHQEKYERPIELVGKDLFYDEILELRDIGVKRIFDITINEPSHVYAYGCFVHNCGGGLPIGRTIMFYGEESSSKTTMATRSLANYQKMCVKCATFLGGKTNPVTGEVEREGCECGANQPATIAVMDVEATFDFGWARCHGLDTSKIVYDKPESGEEAVDKVEALLRCGDIDAILFDSVAASCPLDEVAKSTEDSVMGRGAMLMNRAWRVWNSAQTDAENKTGVRPTVIAINQIRQKIGMVFGNPETKPGGNGQKFATSMEIRFGRSKFDKVKKEDKNAPKQEEEEANGAIVSVYGRVTKNKTAPANREFEFKMALEDATVKDFVFNKGEIIEMKSIIHLATKYGLMGKSEDGKTYFYKDQVFKKQSDLHETMIFDAGNIELVKRDLALEFAK